MKSIQKIILIIAVTCVAAFILSSCGTIRNELGLSDRAGLTYNKQSISEEQLDSELKALASNKPLADLVKDSSPLVKDGKLTASYRANWVNVRMQVLAVKEVRIKNKMKVTAADKKAAKDDAKNTFAASDQSTTDEIWNAFPKSFQNDLIAAFAEQNALVRAAPKVTDDEVKKYFEENKDQLVTACASGKEIAHILVDTKKEAQKIKDQLDDGADFAKLAKKYSKDGSKDSGGSLGCYEPGQFVEEFENEAASLAPGSISGVVKTQYGYHILKASEYTTPTWKDLRSQIVEQLKPEKQSKLYDQVQNSLKKSKVTVLKKYGKVTRDSDNIPSIVPLSTKTNKSDSSSGSTTSTTAESTTTAEQ